MFLVTLFAILTVMKNRFIIYRQQIRGLIQKTNDSLDDQSYRIDILYSESPGPTQQIDFGASGQPAIAPLWAMLRPVNHALARKKMKPFVKSHNTIPSDRASCSRGVLVEIINPIILHCDSRNKIIDESAVNTLQGQFQPILEDPMSSQGLEIECFKLQRSSPSKCLLLDECPRQFNINAVIDPSSSPSMTSLSVGGETVTADSRPNPDTRATCTTDSFADYSVITNARVAAVPAVATVDAASASAVAASHGVCSPLSRRLRQIVPPPRSPATKNSDAPVKSASSFNPQTCPDLHASCDLPASCGRQIDNIGNGLELRGSDFIGVTSTHFDQPSSDDTECTTITSAIEAVAFGEESNDTDMRTLRPTETTRKSLSRDGRSDRLVFNAERDTIQFVARLPRKVKPPPREMLN